VNSTEPARPARPRRRRRKNRRVGYRVLHAVVVLVGLLVAAAAAIAFALRVTPSQSVTALGQTVEVGATSPSFDLSGPGQLELFGQSLPTTFTFTGPVRPKLVLTNITLDQQVANFLSPSGRTEDNNVLGERLAAGWERYFAWEVVFVGLGTLVLLAAFAGLRRPSWRRTVRLVVAGLVLAEGVDLGAIMLTAYRAPTILRRVDSLSALVGRSAPSPIPAAPGPPERDVEAVVLGDSTAAGLGNPLVEHPSALDRACGRSSDSYAADLASVNSWDVENLACSGATIEAGVLGDQRLGSLTASPQLAVAKRAVDATTVLLSIGADDLGWSAMVRLCAASPTCDSRAATAYFQQELHTFTTNYYELLGQLAALRTKPFVIVNLYYVPFDPKLTCLDGVGLTSAKQRYLLQQLAALNAVLKKGAQLFGDQPVQPDFSGHALCSTEPYVQGLADKAPFHPTASGELAIALADERALEAAKSADR
jgi:GDSL-like Lipase/Acylhydrolase family